MPLDVRAVRGVIWDMDNTLYRFTDAFKKSCHEAAAQAAHELGINLSYDDALKLAEHSEREHGYSMHGYITDHGMSYASLHFPFHQRIDESVIRPIPGLKISLQNLDVPQVILTNASRCWADKVTKFIGINHLFPKEKIIPLEDNNFEPKARSAKGFKKALKALGLSAGEVLMVEDLDRNLIIPNKMGIQTAYLHYGDPIPDLPDFIDDQFENAIAVIKALTR